MNETFYLEKEYQKEKTNLSCLILNIVATATFSLSLLYAAITLLNGSVEASQANLAIIESLLGLIIPLAYIILDKVFHLKVNFAVQAFIFIFAFMGIVLGETFHFYYLIPYWDKILHSVSGFAVTFIGFALCYAFIRDNDALTHKVAIALVFGFLFSLAFSVVWEFYEFTVDNIFGLNMQKVMPTNGLFNGGDTSAILNGTDAEIAAFYRTPEGYTYALNDTMTDMLLNALGTVIVTFIIYFLTKYTKADYLLNAITLKKKN